MLHRHMTKSLALVACLVTCANAEDSFTFCWTSSDCDVSGNVGEFCVDFAYYCMETPGGYVAIADDRSIEPCPAGTYAPLPANNPECLDCAPGKYQAESAMSECQCIPAGNKAPDRANLQLCPPGTYFPEDCYAATNCLECDEGKYQSSSGGTECVCSSPGNTANVQKDAEEPCPVGTFSEGECGVCESCPAGKFAASTGSSACIDASAGHVPDSDAAGETPCPPGSSQNETGQSECEPCAPGKYASEAGSTECKDAEAGTHPNANADGVVECPAGSEQPQTGQVACNACPLGKYSSTSGATECECAPDGSQPTADNKGTEECPAGAKSSHHAESGCTVCTDCLPGKYSDTSGQHGSCTCADPGFYPASNSESQLKCGLATYSLGCNGTCTACDAGFYADETGSSECTEAPPGTHVAADAQSAVGCLAGEYQDLPGQAKCRKCDKGMYSDATKSVNCTECPAGKYVGSTGATACIPADKGFVVTTSKSLVQRPCTRGHHADREGMAECEVCGNGKFANESALIDCYLVQPGYMSAREHGVHGFVDQIPCVPGYYNPDVGGSCRKCEAGKFANESGSSDCTCAEPGHYADPSRQQQKKCPIGYKQAVGCGAECLECPAGKTTYEEGSVACVTNVTEEETTTDEASAASFGIAAADLGGRACDDESISTCCPGKYWSKLLLRCEPCSPGHFSVSSGTQCQECAPGEYQDEHGQTQCMPCAGNGFAELGRAIECKPCSFYEHSPPGGTGESCKSCFSKLSYMFGPDICLLETTVCGIALIMTIGGGWYASRKLIAFVQPDTPPKSREEAQPLNMA